MSSSTGTGSEVVPECRHCGAPLHTTMVDLGSSPLCNSFLDREAVHGGEVSYPLHARVCGSCFLVQVGEFVAPDDIFTEYSYFSSYSDSFVAHAKVFVEEMTLALQLGADSHVMEVASNDGYLLQHFVNGGVPVHGIEPALNVAEVARGKGVETINAFLSTQAARTIVEEHGAADLVIANNVMAHTPYLNDFVGGLRELMKPQGMLSVECPHVVRLIEGNQYDTIYHEHFSYFSLYTIEKVFAHCGLSVVDVVELPVHGGTIRVLAQITGAQGGKGQSAGGLEKVRAEEAIWGVTDLGRYVEFAGQVEESKRALLECLIGLKREGKTVVGYGAPGKGNTLLNYCGIGTDFIDYVVDRNPYKQGRFTPGTRIPIYPVERVYETKPDVILIMPWNLRDEISAQLADTSAWGAEFLVALPGVERFHSGQ